jgi:hypothetical protein
MTDALKIELAKSLNDISKLLESINLNDSSVKYQIKQAVIELKQHALKILES